MARTYLFSALLVLGLAAPATADPARDYEAGEKYVREKLEEARSGQVDTSFFTFLVVQTQLKMASGEWGTAVHTAEPLAEMTEIIHGPDSPELADALATLADVYSNVDRLPEAAALLERAVSITRSHRADNPVAHIRTLNSLGATYNLLSRPRESEPPLLEALGLAEQEFGADAPEVGVTAWLLAASYSAQGQTEKAGAIRERADRLLPKQQTGK